MKLHTMYNIFAYCFWCAGKHGFFMQLDQPDDFDDNLGVPLLNVSGEKTDGVSSDIGVNIEDASVENVPIESQEMSLQPEDSEDMVDTVTVSELSDIRNQFDEGTLICIVSYIVHEVKYVLVYAREVCMTSSRRLRRTG